MVGINRKETLSASGESSAISMVAGVSFPSEVLSSLHAASTVVSKVNPVREKLQLGEIQHNMIFKLVKEERTITNIIKRIDFANFTDLLNCIF